MAYNGQYTTIERVLDDVERHYGLDITAVMPDAVEHLADAINLIGVPLGYEQRITNDIDKPKVEVTNYRGTLPCGIYEIEQIRDFDTKALLRPSTNTFHKTMAQGYDDAIEWENTYLINESYIFTDFEECNLEIAYKSFPLDDNDNLKIPDNTRYVRGLVAYVAERLAFKRLIAAEIQQGMYEYINSEKIFYVPGAKNGMLTPDIPQAENLKNMRLQLIVDPNQFGKGFKYLAKASDIRHR